MVKSDGKLTSVNFYQTEKIRLSRRTTRRNRATQKRAQCALNTNAEELRVSACLLLRVFVKHSVDKRMVFLHRNAAHPVIMHPPNSVLPTH